MWIWIIIGACVIGAIIGFIGSDGDNQGADAAGGAMAGGCMARIATAAIVALAILWLLSGLFG